MCGWDRSHRNRRRVAGRVRWRSTGGGRRVDSNALPASSRGNTMATQMDRIGRHTAWIADGSPTSGAHRTFFRSRVIQPLDNAWLLRLPSGLRSEQRRAGLCLASRADLGWRRPRVRGGPASRCCASMSLQTRDTKHSRSPAVEYLAARRTCCSCELPFAQPEHRGGGRGHRRCR